jgi:hypothetical protein
MIMVDETVEQLLESREAKFYLREVARGHMKLKQMFERECRGTAILSPREIKDADELHRKVFIERVEQLESFLDKNVPTWRSEIDGLQTDNRGPGDQTERDAEASGGPEGSG